MKTWETHLSQKMIIVIDTQRNCRLVHTALVKDISYMYCKDIGQCPYKRMSIVQDTIQLQANTVQHLHYSGEMAATMD